MNVLKQEEVIAHQIIPGLIEVCEIRLQAAQKQYEVTLLMQEHKMIPGSKVLQSQELVVELTDKVALIKEAHSLMVKTLEDMNDPTKPFNYETLSQTISKFSKIMQ